MARAEVISLGRRRELPLMKRGLGLQGSPSSGDTSLGVVEVVDLIELVELVSLDASFRMIRV